MTLIQHINKSVYLQGKGNYLIFYQQWSWSLDNLWLASASLNESSKTFFFIVAVMKNARNSTSEILYFPEQGHRMLLRRVQYQRWCSKEAERQPRAFRCWTSECHLTVPGILKAKYASTTSAWKPNNTGHINLLQYEGVSLPLLHRGLSDFTMQSKIRSLAQEVP